jgi:FkbM family methyltransferase|tara:strand:+ start:356 stop:1054 length:699 start_codon:yes stop_codon:yes gene_type:complete
MYNYLKLKYKSLTQKKISYSYNGIDSLIANIFKNKKNGIYIDVGCNHPIKNNNTFLLYKKGWRGINIDADSKSIKIFNYARPLDYNVNIAVSEKNGFENLFFYHEGSSINTLSNDVSAYQKAKVSKVLEVKTQSLNYILDNSPFKNFTIDFLSIDVEGSEMKVLKDFNFPKFLPKVIVVEFLDLNLKKLEIKNLNIENVIKSDLYKLIISKDYTLANWLHSDLVFINNSFKD